MKLLLSQRASWREFRHGKQASIAFAAFLICLITTLTSGLVRRLESAIQLQLSGALAGDLVVQGASQDILILGDSLLTDFPRVSASSGVSFQSMLFSDDGRQLVTVRAVDEAFPLVGQLEVSDTPFGGENRALGAGPERGQIWMESRIFPRLGVAVGDMVELGDARLRVGAVLMREPDRLTSVGGLSPRVLISMDDIASTGVVTEGSRVGYQRSFIVPDERHLELEERLSSLAATDITIISSRGDLGEQDEAGSQTVSSPSRRAQRIQSNTRSGLLLASCSAFLLTLVAAGMAGGRYLESARGQLALLRAFGASRSSLARFYLGVLGWGLAPPLLAGTLIGWGLQLIVANALEDLFGLRLPGLGEVGMLWGLVIGIGGLAVVLLPPLIAGINLAPDEALRGRGKPDTRATLIARWAPLFVLFLLAVQLYTGNWSLSFWFFAGGLVCVLGSWLVAVSIRAFGRGVVRGSTGLLRAFANSLVVRNRGLTQQMLAVALILLPAISLGSLRSLLHSEWDASLSEDAPNHLLSNVLDEQIPQLRDYVLTMDSELESPSPLIRVNLLEPVDTNRPSMNISSQEELPIGNEILSGSWWSDDETQVVSLEEDFADELGLGLGDWIRFERDGKEVRAKVASLREVDWSTLRPNFWVLVHPSLVSDFPATWLASFRLEAEGKSKLNGLVRAFPNIQLYEFDQIVAELRALFSSLSGLLTLVYGLTLVGAVMVLLEIARQEMSKRRVEWALLVAMGVSRRRLFWLALVEYACVGGVAGILGAIGGQFLLYGILEGNLLLDSPQWLPLLYGGLGGALLLSLVSSGYLLASFREEVMDTLRGDTGF